MTRINRNHRMQNGLTRLILLLTSAMIACSTGPRQPFQPEIQTASRDTIAEIPFLLRSTYTADPQPKTTPSPTWTITNGAGTLEPLQPWLRMYRAPEIAQITDNTIETQHSIEGSVFRKTVDIRVHPVNLITPVAGSGFPAQTLTQSNGRLINAVIIGEQVIAYESTFDSGGGNVRLELYKYSRLGLSDPKFKPIRVPLTAEEFGGNRFGVISDLQQNLYVFTSGVGTTSVYKYDLQGMPDLGFGTQGRVQFANGLALTSYTQAAVDDKDIYLIGNTGDTSKVSATRIKTDSGMPDLTYGPSGTQSLLMPKGFYNRQVNLIGRNLVFSGALRDDGPEQYAILKFTATGNPDTGFANRGVLIFPNSKSVGNINNVTSVLGQPGGGLLVFGTSTVQDTWPNPKGGLYESGGTFALTVTKVLPSGQIDSSFGSAGTASISATKLSYFPQVRGYFQNGKIVMVHQPYIMVNDPAQPLVIVTLSVTGSIEKVMYATNGPNIETNGSNARNPAKVWDFAPLPDDSLLTVGPLCEKRGDLPCQMNIGFSRFTP